MNNSYLYVDLGILRANVETLISKLPEGCSLIPVLKDNAYGLGLEKLAPVLEDFDRINTVAVAHVSEGLLLRAAGFQKNILVMGAPLPFQLPAAVASGLTLSAGGVETVQAISAAAAAFGLNARVHVKLDTGLHRTGVTPGEELAGLIAELKKADNIEVSGVFSHFSSAEDAALCKTQYTLYLEGVAQLEKAGIGGLTRHISCSAASELYPGYELDAVRMGRRLYMDRPLGGDGSIKELASWRSYITALKLRKAGERIGYGGKVVLERDALIATVGVGYGDGLNAGLCDRQAPVLIGGQRCRLLACCMDQCLVDVSGSDCKIGDEVTFFGYDREGNFLSSQEIALLIGNDEGCGLTSALSGRVARVYSE